MCIIKALTQSHATLVTGDATLGLAIRSHSQLSVMCGHSSVWSQLSEPTPQDQQVERPLALRYCVFPHSIGIAPVTITSTQLLGSAPHRLRREIPTRPVRIAIGRLCSPNAVQAVCLCGVPTSVVLCAPSGDEEVATLQLPHCVATLHFSYHLGPLE